MGYAMRLESRIGIIYIRQWWNRKRNENEFQIYVKYTKTPRFTLNKPIIIYVCRYGMMPRASLCAFLMVLFVFSCMVYTLRKHIVAIAEYRYDLSVLEQRGTLTHIIFMHIILGEGEMVVQTNLKLNRTSI